MSATLVVRRATSPAEMIADLAVDCLADEIATYPKPGLVSHVDNGSHDDMDAALLLRSARAIRPFLIALAEAGASAAGMATLRAIGIEAEAAMLVATGGINTHRGAIFGLGLLCAAAGLRCRRGLGVSLGEIVRTNWGGDILKVPVTADSHGTLGALRFGAGGARAEAALGFQSIYRVGLPALLDAHHARPKDLEAQRVATVMALIVSVEDTNILYRAGREGLEWARGAATAFLSGGGVADKDWRRSAIDLHHHFVSRRISPGGSADLLAMTLFVASIER